MDARDDFLKSRATGIGGSDAAAILGLSRWKSPFQVYQEKRGEAAQTPDNASMRWGRYLEPVVRQAYADDTGRAVRLPDGLVRHQQHTFMIANLDGVTDDGRVVEIKTARTSQGWGEPGSDQVPQEYLLQVQHYMAVTGLVVADVAVLIGGSDFRLYEVPADKELQDMLISAEAEFWSCVQSGYPPEPTSYADMQAKFGRSSRSDSVLADADVIDALRAIRDLTEQSKSIDSRIEDAKAIVMSAMGEFDTLIDASGAVLATWKASAPAKRLDSAALKDAHPDLYQQFIKTGEPSRRFLIK